MCFGRVLWAAHYEGLRLKFAGKAAALISPNYRRTFQEFAAEKKGLPEMYHRFQLVTDYICGMTDSFAKRLHRSLFDGKSLRNSGPRLEAAWGCSDAFSFKWFGLQRPPILMIDGLRRSDLQAVLFGGTLRSLLVSRIFEGRFGQPRDVDVVVSGAALSELEERFSSIVARRTRFGGLD